MITFPQVFPLKTQYAPLRSSICASRFIGPLPGLFALSTRKFNVYDRKVCHVVWLWLEVKNFGISGGQSLGLRVIKCVRTIGQSKKLEV